MINLGVASGPNSSGRILLLRHGYFIGKSYTPDTYKYPNHYIFRYYNIAIATPEDGLAMDCCARNPAFTCNGRPLVTKENRMTTATQSTEQDSRLLQSHGLTCRAGL